MAAPLFFYSLAFLQFWLWVPDLAGGTSTSIIAFNRNSLTGKKNQISCEIVKKFTLSMPTNAAIPITTLQDLGKETVCSESDLQ